MANIKRRKRICGIYKITSPTGRIYIGQSVDINQRKCKYRCLNCKSQTKIYASLHKYGWDKHKFEIIHVCEPDKLNELEAYYITLYNTFNSRYGMNLRDGGASRGRMSDESKIRIGLAKRGKKIVFSEQHKRRLSEAAKKRGMPPEVLLKAALAAKGRKQSAETIRKRFQNRIHAKGANHVSSKEVLQFDLEGNLIKKWGCLSDITRELGYKQSNVGACCRNKSERAYGFKWKYNDKSNC